MPRSYDQHTHPAKRAFTSDSSVKSLNFFLNSNKNFLSNFLTYISGNRQYKNVCRRTIEIPFLRLIAVEMFTMGPYTNQ